MKEKKKKHAGPLILMPIPVHTQAFHFWTLHRFSEVEGFLSVRKDSDGTEWIELVRQGYKGRVK